MVVGWDRLGETRLGWLCAASPWHASEPESRVAMGMGTGRVPRWALAWWMRRRRGILPVAWFI